MLNRLTPVVKNLVIINVLVFLAQGALPHIAPYFIGHYPFGNDFEIWQVITHMFMHANYEHIVFNMFNLLILGSALENIWGSKKFLQYYILCGIGAFLLFQFTIGIEEYINTSRFITDESIGKVVGASGSVFGLLFAFAYYFPSRQFDVGFIIVFALLNYFLPVNSILILFLLIMMYRNGIKIFPSIPIQAKYLVIFMVAIELYLTIANNQGDVIAHVAHLGGMLFGYILIKKWQQSRTNFY